VKNAFLFSRYSRIHTLPVTSSKLNKEIKMIAVNAVSPPSQNTPAQAFQPPTVNPPASFEATAQAPTLGQDTATFSQTPPTPIDAPAGESAPNTEATLAAEANAPKKRGWFQKGFVGPVIVGSLASIVGALGQGFANSNTTSFGNVVASAVTAAIAMVGAYMVIRAKTSEAPANTPSAEASSTVPPTEGASEPKPVA
jgi:hypothetical protein